MNETYHLSKSVLLAVKGQSPKILLAPCLFVVRLSGMDAVLDIQQKTAISAICAHDPRDLQKLAVQKRKENKIAAELHQKERELLALAKLVALQPITQNPFQKTVSDQLDLIDKAIADASDGDLPRLIDAKVKLYALLFPKPRPSRSRDRQSAPSVIETPQENLQQIKDSPQNG